MLKQKAEPLIWLSDARGVYIPRDFAGSFSDRAKSVQGVDPKAWEILEAGPEHELYWDAWQDVLDYAIVTDEHGTVYRVYQDGDCWLIPDGMEWDDNEGWFAWP